MAQNERITEITPSDERFLATGGSPPQFLSDSSAQIQVSPGDLFFEGLAEAIVRRLDRRLSSKPRLLEIEDAASYLGMTMHALRHKAGIEIPVVRIDNKLRFDRYDLDRYIDRAKREGV